MSETATISLPKIGDPAPDFTAVTTHGEIKFSTWADKSWVVLFSHPISDIIGNVYCVYIYGMALRYYIIVHMEVGSSFTYCLYFLFASWSHYATKETFIITEGRIWSRANYQ